MPYFETGARISFQTERLSKISLIDTPEMFQDLYCLEPGQEQRPHVHGSNAKTYFVLQGEGSFLVDGEERRLGPGHLVLAQPGDPHGVRNDGPQRLVLLVTMAPNPNK